MSIHLERRGSILTVINSRSHCRNAVDAEHAEALFQAFKAFDSDTTLSVAVLWGEGEAFCAGADLKKLAQRDGAGTSNLLDFSAKESDLPRAPMGPTRLQLGKPVIAAIEGPAVGGGMELALWADCRVMAADAYMGIYNRRWGVPLSDGGTVRLPRLIGLGRALEIIMTGRRVDAEECFRIGLCEQVVPHGHAREASEELAHRIAHFPQSGLRADRRSVYLQHGLFERDALECEWRNCAGVMQAEGQQGAAQFAEGAGRHGELARVEAVEPASEHATDC